MAQLVTYFLLLSLVTVSLVAYISFKQAQDALTQSVFDRLDVAATLKEDALDQWISDRRRDLLLITQLPEIKTQSVILLSRQSSDPEYQAAYTLLSEYLADITTVQPNLREIFILSRTGRILISTDISDEGKIESITNYSYVPRDAAETFRLNFYPNPTTGQPDMTFITPLVDENEQQVGTLGAHLNLNRIDIVIREDAGLGKTGKTYLVGDLSTRNVFISGGEAEDQEFPRGIHSTGIDEAMQGNDGRALYSNYSGVPIIGVYRWLDRQDLALLAELFQQEAFEPARQLALTIVIVGLISAGVLALIVYLIARQIARPILAISNAAASIEAGEFDTEALTTVATRTDEVGLLARVFQGMAREVYAREQRLKKQVQELQIVIDEAKKEKDVTEVIESDAFKDIAARAEEMRARHKQRDRTK